MGGGSSGHPSPCQPSPDGHTQSSQNSQVTGTFRPRARRKAWSPSTARTPFSMRQMVSRESWARSARPGCRRFRQSRRLRRRLPTCRRWPMSQGSTSGSTPETLPVSRSNVSSQTAAVPDHEACCISYWERYHHLATRTNIRVGPQTAHRRTLAPQPDVGAHEPGPHLTRRGPGAISRVQGVAPGQRRGVWPSATQRPCRSIGAQRTEADAKSSTPAQRVSAGQGMFKFRVQVPSLTPSDQGSDLHIGQTLDRSGDLWPHIDHP